MTRFDQRISNSPDDWRTPLAQVVDTADAIRLALQDWNIDDPALLLGLTKLALERYDAQQAPSTTPGLQTIADALQAIDDSTDGVALHLETIANSLRAIALTYEQQNTAF